MDLAILLYGYVDTSGGNQIGRINSIRVPLSVCVRACVRVCVRSSQQISVAKKGRFR